MNVQELQGKLGFVEPQWLWLLLAVLLVLIILFRALSAREKIANSLGGRISGISRANLQPGFMLLSAVLTMLVVTLARPYWGMQRWNVPSQGQDIVVLLDLSLSMVAEDLKPNRYEVARRKVLDLVKLVESKRAGDRLGLVPFAGSSYVFCPLTADYGVFRLFLDSLSLTLIQTPGSDLEQAIERGLTVLKDTPKGSANIILISDGEDLSAKATKLAEKLKGSNARLFAIGMGTEQGAPLPIGRGRFATDRGGEIVISRLQGATLSELADATGGFYRLAALDNSDLRGILEQVNKLELGSERVTNKGDELIIERYNELGPYLLWMVGLLLGYLLWSQPRLLFSLSLAMISGQLAWAEPNSARHDGAEAVVEVAPEKGALDQTLTWLKGDDSPYRAKQLLEQGRNAEAAQILEKAAEEQPDNIGIRQALGIARYRAGDFKGAEEAFSRVDRLSQNAGEHFESSFAAGTSALKAEQYQRAIEWYKSALKLKPEDERTRHNLGIAERRLAEKQSQKQNQQQQKQDSKSGSDQNDAGKSDQKEPSQGSSEGESRQEQSKQQSDRSDQQQGQSQQQSESQGQAGSQQQDSQSVSESESAKGSESEANPEESKQSGENEQSGESEQGLGSTDPKEGSDSLKSEGAKADQSDGDSSLPESGSDNQDVEQGDEQQADPKEQEGSKGQESAESRAGQGEQQESQEDELKGGAKDATGQEGGQSSQEAADGEGANSQSEEALTKEQAKAWLDSLFDDKIIGLRQQERARRSQGEQYW